MGLLSYALAIDGHLFFFYYYYSSLTFQEGMREEGSLCRYAKETEANILRRSCRELVYAKNQKTSNSIPLMRSAQLSSLPLLFILRIDV